MADFIQYGQGPKEAMPKHGDEYIGMIYYATDTHETFLYTDTEIVKQTVGAKTADGGEIFNNYEDNRALSANSHASGTNTQAGGRGFQAISCEVGEDGNSLVYSFSNNETTTWALTLLQLEIASVAEATIDITVIPTKSKANPTRSWGNLDYCGKIISIDPSKAQIITTMDSYIAGDKRPWASEAQPATVIVPAYSHIGTIVVGNGANATGWSSKAINAVANASGYNTLAAGKYSNAMNLKTIAGGYAATAGGWETKALGQGSFTHGKQNTVLPNAEFSAAFGEGNEIKWAHNFVVGKYADNTNPRYFVVGGGTDANNRKNLMEIGEKTAIVNVFNSSQSNSIVPKWYLDAWTIKKKAYSGQSNPTWATIEEVNTGNLQSIINLNYLLDNFYDKQDIEQKLTTLQGKIDSKADQTSVETLSGSISTCETRLDEIGDEPAVAEKTTLDEVKQLLVERNYVDQDFVEDVFAYAYKVLLSQDSILSDELQPPVGGHIISAVRLNAKGTYDVWLDNEQYYFIHEDGEYPSELYIGAKIEITEIDDKGHISGYVYYNDMEDVLKLQQKVYELEHTIASLTARIEALENN